MPHLSLSIYVLILNKSWRQHPTRHQLYGHLPPITKTIQVRRTRHAGHCWRSRDELIRDVLLWTPTHGRGKAGRPARTYIQQLFADTGCCPEDQPRAMNDREEWREWARDIRATSATWWWWDIYSYVCMYVSIYLSSDQYSWNALLFCPHPLCQERRKKSAKEIEILLYSHEQLYIHIYIQKHIQPNKDERRHSSLEKYTSHFIERVVCERELETEQNCNILTPTLLDITAFLSRSPALLNRGPGGLASLGHGPHSSTFSPIDLLSNCSIGVLRAPSAGCWFSLQHLISN